jgi:hypothetical protein
VVEGDMFVCLQRPSTLLSEGGQLMEGYVCSCVDATKCAHAPPASGYEDNFMGPHAGHD